MLASVRLPCGPSGEKPGDGAPEHRAVSARQSGRRWAHQSATCTLHKLGGLFRQSVFGRLADYEDVNDAERLSREGNDPRDAYGRGVPMTKRE
jgi:hypothetical protein